MKTVVIAIGLLTALVTVTSACIKGLDLRRWSSWVYGVISFLSGLVLGISLSGNLIESLKMGGIFASMTLLGGVTMRRHRRRYNEDYARSLLLKYGKEDDPSLFAKLVRILLGKYK